MHQEKKIPGFYIAPGNNYVCATSDNYVLQIFTNIQIG